VRSGLPNVHHLRPVPLVIGSELGAAIAATSWDGGGGAVQVLPASLVQAEVLPVCASREDKWHFMYWAYTTTTNI